MRRKPWEEPISYTEDRFPEKPSRQLVEQVGGDLKPDPDLILGRVANPQQDTKPARPRPARPAQPPSLRRPTVNENGEVVAEHVDADPRRPRWRDAGGERSNDDRPLNYARGPHDGELDVDDRDDPNYDI
jgi:hypothetical protein